MGRVVFLMDCRAEAADRGIGGHGMEEADSVRDFDNRSRAGGAMPMYVFGEEEVAVTASNAARGGRLEGNLPGGKRE
jgi:hypothetical protein